MRSPSRKLRSLPVIAMFVVAMACEDTGAPPPTVTAQDSADQVIFGLTHTVTVDGVLRARLRADTAYYYESSQLYDLIGVQVMFFAANGVQSSELTSDFGKYNARTGDMEARVNVVGESADGRILRTEVLNYLKISHELEGPADFALECEGRLMRGASFRADPDFTNVQATQLRGPPCRTR